MRPYRVHVLYEHGDDGRPFSCSHIRLLRPLTHHSVAPWVQLTSGPELCAAPVDLVIVDRLWREDVSGAKARALVEGVRQLRARFLYSLDDDLLALFGERDGEGGQAERVQALQVFLTHADRVIVSTWPLHEVVRRFNQHVSVVPNYLDERLLPLATLGTAEAHRRRLAEWRLAPDAPIAIGYMGTRTHDGDLALVVPALRAVCRRHPGRIGIEIVGGIGNEGTLSQLEGLPYRLVDPQMFTEYPSFLPWFCATCRWQVALAPLAHNALNASKSDIKYLDYAALGAAGIFSRVAVYERIVRHGVTGWLAENSIEAWEAALEHLVTHPVEALSIGWSAQKYLRQYRILAQGAGLWLNMLRLTMTRGE